MLNHMYVLCIDPQLKIVPNTSTIYSLMVQAENHSAQLFQKMKRL